MLARTSGGPATGGVFQRLARLIAFFESEGTTPGLVFPGAASGRLRLRWPECLTGTLANARLTRQVPVVRPEDGSWFSCNGVGAMDDDGS
jgi:hypothetical protein